MRVFRQAAPETLLRAVGSAGWVRSKPEQQSELFESEPFLPHGFLYAAEAITPSEEQCLLAAMPQLPFRDFQFHGYEGKRRVVSFGWRYDFDVEKAVPAPLIPSLLLDTYRAVQDSSGFVLKNLQQVLVTEYAPGAPIGWHKDKPHFGQVMGLSLASECCLRLRRLNGGTWERASIQLQPRSAYFLDGPARWEWEHSIPPVEALRYSITFRNLAGRRNHVGNIL